MKPPQYGTEATRCEEVLGRTWKVWQVGAKDLEKCMQVGEDVKNVWTSQLRYIIFLGGMAMFLVRMVMEDSFWEGGKENTFSCCMVFEGKQ